MGLDTCICGSQRPSSACHLNPRFGNWHADPAKPSVVPLHTDTTDDQATTWAKGISANSDYEASNLGGGQLSVSLPTSIWYLKHVNASHFIEGIGPVLHEVVPPDGLASHSVGEEIKNLASRAAERLRDVPRLGHSDDLHKVLAGITGLTAVGSAQELGANLKLIDVNIRKHFPNAAI